MISDAVRALRETFSPSFRRVMWISLGLTVLLLAAFGAGAQWGLNAMPLTGTYWLDTIIDILSRFIAVVILIPLVLPVTTLVAGLFLESITAEVEEKDYPGDAPGKDQPFFASIVTALRFTLVLIAFNLVALPFYFIPIANVIVFWGMNGYLVGREYFELVALRHRDAKDTKALRRRYFMSVFVAGIAIAAFATVPVLNLFAPVFGTVFMVHTYKRINARAA